jgi:hypothetical protein
MHTNMLSIMDVTSQIYCIYCKSMNSEIHLWCDKCNTCVSWSHDHCDICNDIDCTKSYGCSICNTCYSEPHYGCDTRNAEIICNNKCPIECHACEITTYSFKFPVNYYCDNCNIYSFEKHHKCILCDSCSDVPHIHCNNCFEPNCSFNFKCVLCNICDNIEHIGCDVRFAISN